MTHEDIIKFAQEAGFNTVTYSGGNAKLFYSFAALLTAAEREACADILDRNCDKCDPHSMAYEVLDLCAKAIRARGQK